MHPEDTHTITTQATRIDYSMALVRALAEHLENDEAGRPPLGPVTVYVPHWLEAGEPWHLHSAPTKDGHPNWMVIRGGDVDPDTNKATPPFAFRFGDSIAEAAAVMLAWDQAHPFAVVQEPAFILVDHAA